MFQTNIECQYGITYAIFPVPIGNAKETGEIKYDLQAPIVEYHQNASNNCCFSSLASAFTASGEKIMQGKLQCELMNNYIVNIRVKTI